MKISRFSLNNEIFYGKLDQDKVIRLRSLSEEEIMLEATDEIYSLEDLIQICPINPSRIYGIGDNYPRSNQDLTTPAVFTKASRSLVMNHSEVILPPNKDVWPEPEIGIVIRKELSDLNETNVHQHILGYILTNDVTCVDCGTDADTHNDDSKGHPGFCPVGSFIQTDFNFSNAHIYSEISDAPYRQGRVEFFKWNAEKILMEVSKKYKLLPGDLIITGCPPRLDKKKFFLDEGHIFTARVEGLGELVTCFKKG